MKILSFDAFANFLLDSLEITHDRYDRDTDLASGLGFDSMTLVEVLGVIDGLGASLDDQALGAADTLGDLYQIYAVAVASIEDDLIGAD